MEAGVVKHALNNEIIHVKKKLNQAKIQMINKLTRKVKALKSPKKASEQLKEKLQRKAESAIAEVLLLKKVQPKDLIRFAISHQGQLKDYINKPKVDNEKVFAKILLHKALAEKYVSLRESFANMPVDVLLLTRKERLKLKKERAETLKNKKGKKNKLKNIAEDCDDSSNENIGELKENEKSDECSEEHEKLEEESENEIVENEQENEDSEEEESSNKGSDSKLSPFVLKKSIIMKKELPKNELENVEKILPSTDSTNDEYDENRQDNDEIEIKKNKSLDLLLNPHNVHEKKSSKNQKDITKTELKLLPKNKITKSTGKKLIKKSTKYKNLDLDPEPPVLAKVVDSFFITSSGENYMTLAETRPPDEVKEIHQRGNRQMRRAQMFGNPKPFTRRKDKFHEELGRFGNKDCNTNQSYQKQAGKSSPIKQQDNNFKTSKRFSKMDDSGGKRKLELVPEKLHPSWEAKKQKSGIVAFQGKKVVF